MKKSRLCMILGIWLVLTFAGPLWQLLSGRVDLQADYRTANRESAAIAPLPSEAKEAIIQVYFARAFNWRGMFASHGWIATKAAGADAYRVYQVVGWRLYRNLPALMAEEDIPDRNWYGAAPRLVLDVRGEKAQALIPKIAKLADEYPHAGVYHVWPGPNSNSFPAYVARQLPELGLVMPADAVGKDFLVGHQFFAPTPSGTGYQISLYGLFGVTLARKEGIELNLFGMVYGVQFSPFRILLPGLD